MKLTKVNLCALVMAILIIISSLPLVANAATTSYSKSSNSGIRDEVCTALSPGAVSYYTGNYEYADFIELSSYDLKESLHDLMTDTHKKITKYDDCRDLVWRTDCEKGNTSNATTLYTDYAMTHSDWSPSWNCNREHVWPQSKGGDNTSGGGADLHHIRPEKQSVNSSRGNKSFGTGSGMYLPPDNAKGDVARIILYVYVRWGSAWGADSVTEVFQSVDVLLAWCALDPVDTWEMGRNEVIQDIQGNRNVFIDYPELAWQMFGKAAPASMSSPSGAAANGNVPSNPTVGGDNGNTTGGTSGGNTGGNTGNGTTTPSTGALASFDFGANGDTNHHDGSEVKDSASFTDGSYTLTLNGVTKLWSDARDAKGNSCLKLGTSKATGGFSFTVGSDVKKVVIHVAQYKSNKTIVSVNGTQYTISDASNDGKYTAITIDTSSNKTVTLETTSSGKRCMINTIEFFGSSSSGATGGNTSGNTGSGTTTPDTPSTPTTPSGIPDSFVIKNQDKYVTSSVYAYTSKNGSTKDELKMTDSKSGAAIFKLIKNSDGTVSFKVGSKLLYADGTNVRLVDSESDNTKFILEETSVGYFIKCATATYQDKPQYLEVYSGYLTCYGMEADTSMYTFVFEAVTNSGNSGNDNTGSTTPDSGNKPDDDIGNGNTGSDNTGNDNTGNDNTGSDNTGNDNTESDNTGSDNTGNDNTGSDNTGNDNTGSDNTGSDNTGNDNTGSDNTGNDNTEGGNNGNTGNNGSEDKTDGHTELDSIPEIPWPEDDKSDNTVLVWVIAAVGFGAIIALGVFFIIKKKK